MGGGQALVTIWESRMSLQLDMGAGNSNIQEVLCRV